MSQEQIDVRYVLPLYFEKTEGKVDWSFLEGTLRKLGFNDNQSHGFLLMLIIGEMRRMRSDIPIVRIRIPPCSFFLWLILWATCMLPGTLGLSLPIEQEHELLDIQFAAHMPVIVREIGIV